MTATITAAEMRALERAAMDSGTVTGLELMERAGQGVVDAILEQWPDMATAPHRAVILCGPGNNGGDGFVVARLLLERGWSVHTFFVGDAARLPLDARANYDRLNDVIPFNQDRFEHVASHMHDLEQDPSQEDLPPFLLVDALFGIGLSRPLSGLDELIRHWDYLTNFRDLNAARVVAIDICSGLNADTGEVFFGDVGAAPGVLPADLTVTFHAAKPGHVQGPHHHVGGTIVVKGIGL